MKAKAVKAKAAKSRAVKAKTVKAGAKKKSNGFEGAVLRLYIAGQTPKSMTALRNLKKICEVHQINVLRLEVIDLVKQPQLAKQDQILAIPTLVRNLPTPIRKIIGDLSNAEKVLIGLDIIPLPAREAQ